MKKFWQSKILWNNILGLAALAVQSQTSYLAPVEAQAALLALSNIVLRGWFSGQTIDWSQIKLPGGKATAGLLILGAFFSTLMLSGCSTIKVVDKQPVLSELAVRVAVGRVLSEHPSWATPTQTITANAIRVVNESDDVALPELQQYVQAQIPWGSLNPEETALIQALIPAIVKEIESSLPAPTTSTPPEIRVRVATVLGWINQTAEVYAVQQRK